MEGIYARSSCILAVIMISFVYMLNSWPTSTDSNDYEPGVPCYWRCPLVFDDCLKMGESQKKCYQVYKECGRACRKEALRSVNDKR